MPQEYFIDALTGNDNNSGNTPDKAWQSLTRAQTACDAGRVGLGSALYIKAGTQNYGMVPYYLIDSVDTFNGRRRFEIDSYGTGPKPEIIGYKVLSIASAWTLVTESGVPAEVWRIDLTAGNTATHAGYVAADGANIGHLYVNGSIKPNRKGSVSELSSAWDFYTDLPGDSTRYLYVKSPGGNPTSITSYLGAAPNLTAILTRSGTTVRGLDVHGWGQHGARLRTSGKITREVVVEENLIRDIGGSRQAGSDGTGGTGSRYGNGVEVWIGAKDTLTRFNEFRDIYDVPWTMQGDRNQFPGWDSWERNVAEFNVSYRSNQSIEFWARQDFQGTGGFIKNRVHHNAFFNAGYSWGESVRGQQGRGTHILTYGMGPEHNVPIDIEIDNNVFWGVKDGLRYHQNGTDYSAPALNAHDNTYIAESDHLVAWNQPQTVQQFDAWRTATNQERGSVFLPLPTAVEIGTVAGDQKMADAKGAAASILAEISSLQSNSVSPYTHKTDIKNDLSNVYITPRRYGSSSGTTFSTVDTLIWEPWEMTDSGMLNALTFDVITAGSAGSSVRAAILLLAADGVTWMRIANPGAVSTTSTGMKSVSLSTARQFVRPGDVIGVGLSIQNGTGTALRAHTGLTNPRVRSSTSSNVVQTGLNSWAVAGVNGDNVPTVITSPAGSGTTPIVGLQLV